MAGKILSYKDWSLALEQDYLEFYWTLHAKITVTDRELLPKVIEDVLLNHIKESSEIQECENSDSQLKIVQQKISGKIILKTIKDSSSSKKDYPKASISEKQIQEQDDIQTKKNSPIGNDNLISLRNNTVYFYDEEVDIISLYFARKSSGYNHSEEAIENKILVSYDNDEKIVSLNIFKASKNLSCHLYDLQVKIDNKPPLVLLPIYNKSHDELRVYFHGSISPTIIFERSEEEGIEVAMNDSKKIIALLFRDSSKKVRNDC
ncbi:hypothetical protein C1645_819961 [Glomus cerebriforme]|uniref:Uncharacterized protein n=1 Tax=Glomus cerebriforme TaxID=658196 RepID=A0A397T807_9GLOM|nr:hypothetical protein C1645_819961 [Glomus cerebriforme]